MPTGIYDHTNCRTGKYVKCATCKKEIWVWPSWTKKGYGKYCSRKCHGISRVGKPGWNKGQKWPERSGKNHHNWKGGRCREGGYIHIYSPDHPFCTRHKYVKEHRLVVEKHLKRYLTKKEIVHHINGITDDNRLENLMLFKNQPYHMWFHKKGSCNPNGIIFDGSKI